MTKHDDLPRPPEEGAGKEDPAAPAQAGEGAAADQTRAVGRGVIAISFAKLYFILTGFIVQFGLPRILEWVLLRGGASPEVAPLEAKAIYGDYKLVNSTVSQ